MAKDTQMKNDKRIFTMAQEKPVKAVLKMGLPVTAGMMFMVFYNLADTYFIGLLNDYRQLAATNLSYPIMMIMIAISGIVGNGGASYIARCIGAGKKEEAEHTLTIGFELILISSAVLTLTGVVFIDPVVKLIGADGETFGYTKDYTIILVLGCVFIMGNYAVGQLLRSEGSTKYSMVGMIVGNILNIVLDWLFIIKLGMEIKGAALATVIGNIAGLGISLIYYAAKKTLLSPSVRFIKMDKNILKEIFLVGIPHTLEQFFSTTAIIVSNNLAVKYENQAVAAIGISNKIMTFGNYIYQGMAAGSQPLMGYNYGAKNYSRMKQLFRSGIIVITSMELIVTAVYGIFAPFLISRFSSDQTVISIGIKTLRASMLMLPFVGTTSLARNTFNSMGKPMYAFGITIIRQLVLYIPFMLIFDRLWGYTGLIHAQPAEELLCMIVSVFILITHINSLDEKNNDADKNDTAKI